MPSQRFHLEEKRKKDKVLELKTCLQHKKLTMITSWKILVHIQLKHITCSYNQKQHLISQLRLSDEISFLFL